MWKEKVSNYTKLLILVTKSKMGYRARVWWGTYSFYFMYLRYLNLLAVSMFLHINHWTALLEYNLHTTKLSHFKCTIQWLLANLLNLRVVSSPPKWWCKVGSGTMLSAGGASQQAVSRHSPTGLFPPSSLALRLCKAAFSTEEPSSLLPTVWGNKVDSQMKNTPCSLFNFFLLVSLPREIRFLEIPISLLSPS